LSDGVQDDGRAGLQTDDPPGNMERCHRLILNGRSNGCETVPAPVQ
jgi:hypothetical protein